MATAAAQVEPTAGTWPTWLLAACSQPRPDSAPSAEASQAELTITAVPVVVQTFGLAATKRNLSVASRSSATCGTLQRCRGALVSPRPQC